MPWGPEPQHFRHTRKCWGEEEGHPESFRENSRHFRHTAACPVGNAGKHLELIRDHIKGAVSLHSRLELGGRRTKQRASGGGPKKGKLLFGQDFGDLGVYLLNFKINFTLTNLPFSQNLSSANSKASQNVTSLISQMLQNTSMGSVFSSCIPISFSPSQVIGTAVSLSCRFKNDTSVPPFNKVDIYRQLNQKTNNGTLLGPYSIAKDSLYVNGYHEITPQPDIPLLYFTINFTLPNLPFSQNLSSGNSSASRNVTSLISQMLQNTTMGSEFSSCVPISFSPSQVTGTAVSLSCRFKNDTSVPPFNKVDIYRQLNQKTNNGTVLGPYSIAKDSLYVSGYREIIPQPVIRYTHVNTTTALPVTAAFPSTSTYGTTPVISLPGDKSFSLNFTIINRNFTSDLSNPNSDQYKEMVADIIIKFKPINQILRSDSDKENIYKVFKNMTNELQDLGPFKLDKNSLFVNGYTQVYTTTAFPSTSTYGTTPVISLSGDKIFSLNFTIININFTSDLNNPNSDLYKQMVANITNKLFGTVAFICARASSREPLVYMHRRFPAVLVPSRAMSMAVFNVTLVLALKTFSRSFAEFVPNTTLTISSSSA
ncbi:MUC16 protein, partial [Polypterus senegalus]